MNVTPTIFSDVDGTLINIKSMFSFLDFFKDKFLSKSRESKCDFHKNHTAFLRLLKSEVAREEINLAYYRQFSGLSEDCFNEIADAWANQQRANMSRLLIYPVIEEINRLKQRLNGNLCFVSGSLPILLKPFMEEIGADYCLATNLIVQEATFTGEISSPQTIGEGKAKNIELFLKREGLDRTICFAFGDHRSDIPMLKSVGTAVAVIGDSELEKEAKKNDWKRINIS